MKRGFTLVELLAVIVIISILTVLTVTVVSNLVKSGKEELNDNQQTLILKAAELWGTDNIAILPDKDECFYITLNDLINNGYIKDDLHDLETDDNIDTSEINIRIDASINPNGKLIYKYDINPTDLDGCGYIYEKPKYTITFNTMGGTEIASVRVTEGDTVPLPKAPQKHEYKFREWMLDNTVYDFDTPVTGDMTLIAAYDLTDQYTMMTGQNFNKAVKTLVKGSTVSSYSTNDNTVEHIEFYSNGELPNGYTLSQLQALPSTIVSLTGETIKAYYDSTSKSIYVYSSGEIVWNSTSTYIFSYFNKLNTFEIPYNVTSIVDRAFYGSGLTSITIPSSVTSIGIYAFYDTSLTSITIPSSVTSIGNYAFSSCTNLSSITVDPNNQIFEDRNSNAIIKKSNNELVVGCKNTIIPDSVTIIGNYAFYGCTGLTSITIPSSVTSIRSSAFANCTNLSSIDIPNSITGIGSSAFANCTGLTSITIPSSVTSILSSAFDSCKNVTSITVDPDNQIFEDRNSNAIIKKSNNQLIVGCKNTIIPNSVTSIGERAFYGSSLTSITIPSSVTSIGNYAFALSSNITSITIPSSVTYISNNVFYGSSKLTAISFELPTGWWYADSASATSGTSIDLSDANQNATYFKITYKSMHWKNGS